MTRETRESKPLSSETAILTPLSRRDIEDDWDGADAVAVDASRR
jgi:hypothetical protein